MYLSAEEFNATQSNLSPPTKPRRAGTTQSHLRMVGVGATRARDCLACVSAMCVFMFVCVHVCVRAVVGDVEKGGHADSSHILRNVKKKKKEYRSHPKPHSPEATNKLLICK